MNDLSKIESQDDSRLGSPPATPQPFHADMPAKMFAAPAEPEETFGQLLARFFDKIEELRGLKYQDCGEVADAEQEIAALVESDRPDEAGVHEAFDKLRIALTEKRMGLEEEWFSHGRYEYAADNAPTPRYFRGM